MKLHNTVYFQVSCTMFFDFVVKNLKFCSITHLRKRWQSDKVKEHCVTNLKVHCVTYVASLSYKVFKWHSLNIEVIARYLVSQYSKLCTVATFVLYLQLANSWSIRVLLSQVATLYVYSCYSQIITDSDWPHILCTLSVLFSIQSTMPT